MTQPWFSDKRTRLSVEAPEKVNISYQETHAQNIFERYFQIDKDKVVDASLYGKNNRFTQDWLNTVLRHGTSRDKVLALAFLIKAQPKYSLCHLESLLNLISPAKKQTCLKAIDVMTNLFDTVILPGTRTLISFENRPFDNLSRYQSALSNDLSLLKGNGDLPANCSEYVLCLWYYENRVKQIYFQFLSALENILLRDTIPKEKNKALNALVTLVSHKPEGRETILAILVNKLGDRSKTIASSVIHKLRGLITQRSNLKSLLVEQLRTFLFRPNLLDRAKYYSIVLLSSIPLTKNNEKAPGDEEKGQFSETTASISAILFKVYLSFFRATVEADELPERLTTALLTGISRVAPYLSGDLMASNVTDIDAVFRLVHVTTNFVISLQALTFLFHFTNHQPQLIDRYYQSLYRKLVDQSLRWTCRGPSLLHLVYRSLFAERNFERKVAFVQRLLGVCLTHPDAGFVAAVHILLEKIRTSTQNPSSFICITPSSKQKQDTILEAPRSKKLLPTAIGVVKEAVGSDSDEEYFSDAPGSDEEEELMQKPTPHMHSTAAWDHRHLKGNQPGKKIQNVTKPKKSNKVVNGAPAVPKAIPIGYNLSARDPRFANAANQPCWQLIMLTRHAHPTVSLFARNLIDGKAFTYTGNPFDDLSVNHFIERFVYKKPKSEPTASKSTDAFSKQTTKQTETRVGKPKTVAKSLSVDSLAYRNLPSHQIPSDEQFIHSYFKFIGKQDTKKESESDESDIDDEFDAYLEKHEKGLIPNDSDGDDYTDDEDFNYSFDEGKPGDADDGDDNKEELSGKEDHMEEIEPNDEEEDDFSMSDMDEDSEDEFGPPSKRCKKLDLNKLFVSADEVGELYDTQDAVNKKRSKWQNKRLAEFASKGSSHSNSNKLRSKRKRR